MDRLRGLQRRREACNGGPAADSRVNPPPPFFGVRGRRRRRRRRRSGDAPRDQGRRIGDTAAPPPGLPRMFVRGLGTAIPSARYTKAQCLEAFERSAWFARLDSRSHMIARLVLQRDNGIESRHLALDSLDEVFAIDPDTLDRRFLAHAPALAPRPARRRWPRRGSQRARSTRSSSAPAPATSAPGSRATSSSGSACAPTCRRSTWSARAAPRRCRTCSSAARCSARAPRTMCSRSASRSAAPRCTSTTTRAC